MLALNHILYRAFIFSSQTTSFRKEFWSSALKLFGEGTPRAVNKAVSIATKDRWSKCSHEDARARTIIRCRSARIHGLDIYIPTAVFRWCVFFFCHGNSAYGAGVCTAFPVLSGSSFTARGIRRAMTVKNRLCDDTSTLHRNTSRKHTRVNHGHIAGMICCLRKHADSPVGPGNIGGATNRHGYSTLYSK